MAAQESSSSPQAHALSDNGVGGSPKCAEEDPGRKLDFYGHEVVFNEGERVVRERSYQSTAASYDESREAWAADKERIDDIIERFGDRERKAISRKDWKFVKGLCRNGVPFSERPRVWFSLCGAAQEKKSSPVPYEALKTKAMSGLGEKVARQIEGDIHRTFPSHPTFQRPEGTECLKGVLSVFALVHPDVGYAQGLNFVAGMLIMVCGHENEEDVFWMLTAVVHKRMYPNTYGEDLKGCHVGQKILDRLVQKKFPRVYRHFEALGCELSLVTSEWLLCLFSRSFPPETVARIWDSLLFEGFKIFYRVSLGFIRLHHDEILRRDNLGDLVTFLKEEVRCCVNNEQVMRRAFHGIGSMRSSKIIKYAIKGEEEVDAMLEGLRKRRVDRQGG
ncbi:Rab-GTPase-TBC domain-containing protein [Chloropicon roscoffensis]|uniref:Rab-GTPase-TBC domain-containing protein n=1 Tax=Chloropicon roscoffensis TaxID=1461544 RepID=A0AAX4P158_9CHLO